MNVDLHIVGDGKLRDAVRELFIECGFQVAMGSENFEDRGPKVTDWRKSLRLRPGRRSQLLVTNGLEKVTYGVPVIRLFTIEEASQGVESVRFLPTIGPNECTIYYVDIDDLKIKLTQALLLVKLGVMVEKRQSLFYQAVTQYSHDGIICVDGEGIVTVFNQRASEVLGVPIDRALGQPLVSFNPTAGLPRVLQQREIELEDVISVNGRRVAANRVPIAIEGEIVGAISTFQDVTQLQKYEQMIRRKLRTDGFEAKYTFDDIVAVANSSRRIKESAHQCGKVDATVLIAGESGTGKELFAQSMHNISARARGPFVAVNCAALPDSLLESELFGYDEGAFTGANRGGKQGLFELAHGGTLFLDEIGELPLSFQGRLLRVLQQREVLRVGGKAMIPVDVRVIAATHQPLRDLVRAGSFRSDLFYRLYVLSLHVPPLRERKEDIIPLAQTFLRELADKYHKSHIECSDKAFRHLLTYDWPGNVRELRNVIERAIVMTPENGTVPEEMIAELWMEQVPVQLHNDFKLNPQGRLANLDDIQLLQLFEQTHNISLCAARMGIHRTTVWRRLKKLKENGLISFDSPDMFHH